MELLSQLGRNLYPAFFEFEAPVISPALASLLHLLVLAEAPVCAGPRLDLSAIQRSGWGDVDFGVALSAKPKAPVPCTVNVDPGAYHAPEYRGALTISLEPTPKSVAPSGKVALDFVVRNPSAKTVSLDLSPYLQHAFALEYYDASGKRLDQPEELKQTGRYRMVDPDDTRSSLQSLPSGGGLVLVPASQPQPQVSILRVSLAPGGEAHVAFRWAAVKRKQVCHALKLGQSCSAEPAGPLPKGTYTLRLITPLIGTWGGEQASPAVFTTNVEVK